MRNKIYKQRDFYYYKKAVKSARGREAPCRGHILEPCFSGLTR